MMIPVHIRELRETSELAWQVANGVINARYEHGVPEQEVVELYIQAAEQADFAYSSAWREWCHTPIVADIPQLVRTSHDVYAQLPQRAV